MGTGKCFTTANQNKKYQSVFFLKWFFTIFYKPVFYTQITSVLTSDFLIICYHDLAFFLFLFLGRFLYRLQPYSGILIFCFSGRSRYPHKPFFEAFLCVFYNIQLTNLSKMFYIREKRII